jgi:hypothetical protein
MKLTSLQYRGLKNYLGFHDKGWPIGFVLRLMGWRWLLLAIIGLAGGYILFELQLAAGLVAGMCFGAILRDIGTLRRASQMWLITDEIINWQRVSELIDLYENRQQQNA